MGKYINIYTSLNQASEELAHYIQQYVAKHSDQDHIRLAFSGGSTPTRLFEHLKGCELAYENLHIFLVDERLVPLSDDQSNFGQLYAAWLQWVEIPQENLHPVRVDLDASLAAIDYEQQVMQFSEEHHPPAFDIIVLGLGEDGHVASIFPHLPIQEPRLVQAVEAQYKDRPGGRVTFTPRLINAAKNIIFLVSGENKAPIVKKALTTVAQDPGLPVSSVNPNRGSVNWFIDAAAASLLDSPALPGAKQWEVHDYTK